MKLSEFLDYTRGLMNEDDVLRCPSVIDEPWEIYTEDPEEHETY
jgi:hypothetical protein